MYRKTFAEVDLTAIKHNLLSIKKTIGKNKKILLPVKADAYGHGIVAVSQYVEKENLADMLGVASLDEGVELRKAGITLPILILGLTLPDMEQIEALVQFDLTQTVADIHTAKLMSQTALQNGTTGKIHLKIDTGMGRIGCQPGDAITIAREISSLPHINCEGIFTHFPVADENDPDFTDNQIKIFTRICDQLKEEGINIPIKHTANSAGIMKHPLSYFDMVRPGIISYGYLPASDMEKTIDIIPAMTLKSSIVFIKPVSANTPLCYGLTYSTKTDTHIATVPIGYGDGYSRFLSNKGQVLINNKKYPVVGRVSMDQTLIDIGNDSLSIGDEVILFGKETITANTIADWINTIPYEITCSISKRVPKVYTQ